MKQRHSKTGPCRQPGKLPVWSPALENMLALLTLDTSPALSGSEMVPKSAKTNPNEPIFLWHSCLYPPDYAAFMHNGFVFRHAILPVIYHLSRFMAQRGTKIQSEIHFILLMALVLTSLGSFACS